MGGELLGVSGWEEIWGIDAWPVVGMVDGVSPADECGLSSALVFSLYFPASVLVFPIPIGPVVSLTSRTPSCLLFPTITTLVCTWPDAESCCCMSHPMVGC